MRPIYILTISFIVLLQIENGENANNTSTEKGDDHEQGSFSTIFPNNFTNQEETTQSSTSSLPNTDDRTSVSNITFSDPPIVNKHPTTVVIVPSFSSENEVPVSEKAGRDKDNFNVSEEPSVMPSFNTTIDLSDLGTSSTSRHNSEQPISDMYTSQTLTKVMSDSDQTTTSNQIFAEEKLEIYDITTQRINSTCMYLMWEINQAGNFTFKILPGKLDVVASNLTRFKEVVCSDKLPGKVVTYKIRLFLLENKVKEKKKRVHFEPSTPTNLDYNKNNTLSWKEGNGNTDYYELRYLTKNTEMVQEVNDTKFSLEEVVPGETLNISLYAVRNFKRDNVTLKSEPAFKEITTIPLRPKIKIKQNLESIDVLIQSGIGYRDGYMITYSNNTLNYNVSRSYMDKLYDYNIPDLAPAQYYDITVVSFSNGIRSQPATTRTSTCPQIHSVNVKNITSTSFVVYWNGDYNNETITEVHINDTKYLASNSDRIDINNLESTTIYSVAVSLSFNGCNVTSDTIHELTMDAHLKPIENLSWKFEKSNKLILSWKPPVNAKNTIRNYEVNFEDLNSNIQILQSLNATQTDFKATYGECYNVKIAGVNRAGRGEFFSQYIYIPEDVPETVSDVTPTNIQSTSVTIQWKEPAVFKGTIIKYTVVLYDSNNSTFVKKTVQCDESCYKSQCLNNTRKQYQNSTKEETFIKDQDELKVGIGNLKPFHNYSVKVIAYTKDNKSEPVQIQFITEEDLPGRIDKNSIVAKVHSSDATIKWKPPTEPNGVILSYDIELLDNIGYKDSKNTTDTSVTFYNLQQVTEYSVRISAKTSKGFGTPSDFYNFTTKFADLSQIQDFGWEFDKERNQIKMQWKKPENGIESNLNYSLKIVDLNSNRTEFKKIAETEARFKATYGECYNVTIAGVNNAGGGDDITQYIYIPEDVPETVSDVTPINIKATSVTIQWKEPAVFKGTIIKYTVVLYDSNNSTFVKKTVQCDESCYKTQCLNTNLRRQRNVLNMNSFRNGRKRFEVVFEDLKPYQNYSVEITAFTRTNESEPVDIHFMTDEDVPGRIDKNSIVAEVSSSDATIKWKPPTEPNGVILSYNIELLDNIGYKDSKNTTDTSVTFYNLQQVTEYSVRIKARTSKGFGNFSDLLRFSTKLKVPSKPENVKVVNKTSTSLTLVWTRPANDLNISHYVQVNDTVWDRELKNIICGTHSRCHIPGLKAFWNYSLQVNVANNEGSSSSEIIRIQTLEDKPGKVSKFEALPEGDISEPRTISLEWDPPKQEDRNGKIINYVISYGQALENKKEIKIGLQTKYILRDIVTDVQYEIELAAVTIVGTGVKDTRKVIVPPGILPKPIEVIPLIKHLPAHLVQDKRHQIPLQLPFGFLCNTSYGEIISRGILATRGTRYVIPEMKSRPTYPSWYEAKDSKTLLTYQVSGLPSFKNCRYEEGHKIFIVGNDKDCKNIPGKYCNGNLLPDTLYRFKIFICTKAGCTYSNFSYPIKTDKVSNTVLISCIVVLIVCIVIAVTAFLLYRKKACFAVFDGDSEKNNLDLRVYKSNRNRPVKLSNFEAHVQTYHQNTNIGFSEEYKVIKQLSPKYSTKAAERESCRIKNRYTNVLPFDSTRVKLLPVDDEEDSEYINANYIPGYNGKREYIAAQGPLPSTTDDFWRMLWENQVSVVVMLTNCMEKGRVKCEKYWPESCDPVHYGDLVVQLRSESNLPDYNIRVLDIKLGMKTRTIKQFHFLKWPDFGCPEKTWLLLNFVTAVRAHLSNSSTGPIVVHCSAGVGRTGTFIAVDMLLQQIHDSEEIDIFGLVLEMRENRSLMVQTENQYIYIHDCIRDALIDDPDEEEEIDEHIYENQVIYENS